MRIINKLHKAGGLDIIIVKLYLNNSIIIVYSNRYRTNKEYITTIAQSMYNYLN